MNSHRLILFPVRNPPAQQAPVRLTELDLEPGLVRRVVRIDAETAVRVLGFGIYPGVEIELKQSRPCYVIQCENSEVAMEKDLARGIWVES